MGINRIVLPQGHSKPLKLEEAVSCVAEKPVFWTDGKTEFSGKIEQLWFLKSPSDGRCFWLDECEEVAVTGGTTDMWSHAAGATSPDEDDYWRALSTTGESASSDKLKYLHLRFWWAGNDRIRRATELNLPDRHIEVLQSFLRHLRPDNCVDRLLIAEIYRELRAFSDSEAVLNFDFPLEYLRFAMRVRELARVRDAKVARVL